MFRVCAVRASHKLSLPLTAAVAIAAWPPPLLAQGREQLSFFRSGIPIRRGEAPASVTAFVEEGAESARFVLEWRGEGTDLDLTVIRPDGTQLQTGAKTIGKKKESYVVRHPLSGAWTMRVTGVKVPASGERFSLETAVVNDRLTLAAGLARPVIQAPGSFLITARPSIGHAVSGCRISAHVTGPDGETAVVELKDDGSGGDGAEDDGLYHAVFRNATSAGEYSFVVFSRCEKGTAYVHNEGPPGIGPFPVVPGVPTFERVRRFSGSAQNASPGVRQGLR